MNIYQELLNALSKGKRTAMVTSFNEKGKDCISKALYTEDQLTAKEVSQPLAEKLMQAVESSLSDGKVEIVNNDNKTMIIEPFYPEPHLVILGGGHIAKPLCEYAAKVGFVVTIIDDRPMFANKNRFSDAEEIICAPFAAAINSVHFSPYTYVVIVTRGHRHDLDCLQAILPKPWAYAGMIGSKRRVTGILEQLKKEGYSEEVLAKINTPIGLPIGAVTPEEIAVSILAQLISYRRLENPRLGDDSKAITRTEFDRQILEELAQGHSDKKAIATVIATKGSVPRKAGAKMLIWPDGRILGSIGGGCSESEVIRQAREIMDNGGCKLFTVDLTGEVAEDMGMVCGGIMQVLIESWAGQI